MKKYIIPVISACVALMAASCQKVAIDPISGDLFPEAKVVTASTLSSMDVVKGEKTRTFTFTFSGDSQVKIALVGNTYFLAPTTYTSADDATAGNGNLLKSASSFGGKSVASGSVIVKKSGDAKAYSEDDEYEFSTMVFLSDGTPYKFEWAGKLAFEPDPEPVSLSVLMVAQKNMNNTVTVKLGSDGMSVDGYGTPTAAGYALTADLYSADGYLHEGVFTAAAGETVGEGEYTPGYMVDYGEYGVFHWGTCWWVYGEATHITTGPLTVAKKGAKWVISWGSEETYPNWAVFEGKIDELTPGDVPNPDYTFVDTAVEGAMDSSWQTHTDVTTHNVTVYDKNEAEVAYFQLVLANGTTDLSGEYECKEYAHEDHTCGNGYDAGAYGIGGTRYYKGEELVFVNPGETVLIVKLAEGIYEVSGDGFDFVIGAPGAGGDVDADYTIVDTPVEGAMDSSWQTHTDVTTHNVTLFDAEAKEVAYFQLVLANGTTDLSGDYSCVEYAHEDHTCGNGYDAGAYGIGGTRYYQGEELVFVNPGESVTVTAMADGVYKFSGEGFEFVGKLAEE